MGWLREIEAQQEEERSREQQEAANAATLAHLRRVAGLAPGDLEGVVHAGLAALRSVVGLGRRGEVGARLCMPFQHSRC